MSDEEKNQENNSQQDLSNNSQDKPQSYGIEPVQKELKNLSKTMSYGTTQVLGGKKSISNTEESNE